MGTRLSTLLPVLTAGGGNIFDGSELSMNFKVLNELIIFLESEWTILNQTGCPGDTLEVSSGHSSIETCIDYCGGFILILPK